MNDNLTDIGTRRWTLYGYWIQHRSHTNNTLATLLALKTIMELTRCKILEMDYWLSTPQKFIKLKIWKSSSVFCLRQQYVWSRGYGCRESRQNLVQLDNFTKWPMIYAFCLMPTSSSIICLKFYGLVLVKYNWSSLKAKYNSTANIPVSKISPKEIISFSCNISKVEFVVTWSYSVNQHMKLWNLLFK